MPEQNFVEYWVSAQESLQKYAHRLSRDRSQAEDLLQQAALNAWSARHQLGSIKNVPAWLRAILRNAYCEQQRKRRVEEVDDPDGTIALSVGAPPSHDAETEVERATAAVNRLPKRWRRPLTLVAIDGLSYIEASRACSCKLNTLKSRISRARARLVEVLDCAERARSRPAAKRAAEVIPNHRLGS